MSAIVLTPLGKHEAEKAQGSGPDFAILSMLYETNGPVDFDEIVEETHMSEEKASMVVRKMINQGHVKEI